MTDQLYIKSNLLLLTLLLTVSACTSKTEVVQESTPTVVHDGGPLNENGGIDSGGGNGIGGKMLEDYRFDLTALPEYSKVIEIIDNLATTFPELAGNMWHIGQARAWYRIPGHLDTLPSERIGVAFQTEQVALQNTNEIWIDDTIFQPMAEDAKISLIIHEMVVGVRILQFKNSVDQCMAKVSTEFLLAKTNGQKAKFNQDEKSCNNPLQPGTNGTPVVLLPQLTGDQKISLNADTDYPNIRYVVGELISTDGKVDGEQLRGWMNAEGFRVF